MLLVLFVRILLRNSDFVSVIDVIDVVGHIVMPAAGAPLLLRLLQNAKFLPALRSIQYIFIGTLLGTTLEVMWEIFEFAMDGFVGGNWQPSNTDTMIDLISALVGAGIGSALFLAPIQRQVAALS